MTQKFALNILENSSSNRGTAVNAFSFKRILLAISGEGEVVSAWNLSFKKSSTKIGGDFSGECELLMGEMQGTNRQYI